MTIKIDNFSTNGGSGGGGVTDLVASTLATASNVTASTINNSGGVTFDIPVTGSNATSHHWGFNIDGQSFITASATGDGSGSIVGQLVEVDQFFSVVDAGASISRLIDDPGVTSDATGLYIQYGQRDPSGTLTTGYGLHIDTPFAAGAGGGTVTTAYGLFIEDQTDLFNITDAWAIYTNGGKHWFQGFTGIGGIDPQCMLDVDGQIRVSSSAVFGPTLGVNQGSFFYVNYETQSIGNSNVTKVGESFTQVFNPLSGTNTGDFVGQQFYCQISGVAAHFNDNKCIGTQVSLSYQRTTNATNLVGLNVLSNFTNTTNITNLTGIHSESVVSGIGTLTAHRGISVRTGSTAALTSTYDVSMYVYSPTLSGGGTIGEHYGLFMEDQNIGTNSWAIKTQKGKVQIGGRFLLSKASGSITSANDLTLFDEGNTFLIDSGADIHGITVLNWITGSQVTLIFTGAVIVKHNTAGGAGTAPVFLDGSVDLSAANNTVLGLIYDGTQWQQTFLKAA